MPLYEYECTACGERTEAIQAFSDPPLTICPVCGGTLRKLLSTPAFQFKGTGWYVTDYANASRKKSMEAEKGASGNGGDKSSEKKEANAEKTDTKSGSTTKDAKASD